MNISLIAKIAHSVNRAYCQSIGDDSQVPWDEAPEWQRVSSADGVKFMKLNPECGHDALHNAWVMAKVADGWVYGPVKDAAKKTHPCLVPYSQLPKEQQTKDALFSAVVRASLS